MLLDRINSPQELRSLSVEELIQLAAEIRQRIVEVVSRTGGHLASSLGAVELIIALHYCLDTPKDKIVFDVGHQSYAHKIITGRNKDFDTLRQYRGLSGFPSKEESEYDPFTTGHSSSAISLAMGLACGRDASKGERFRVAAVVGDGSLSGGLCFEGLNNAGHLKKDILVILNTNDLSISEHTGAISNYLNKIISLPIYNRFKESLENFAQSRLPKGSRIIALVNKFEESLKGLFVPGLVFEELGFRYFGPFDGHDLRALIPTLKNILTIKGPRLLHVVTKKGKGYLPAEAEPVRFHGTSAFDPATGKSLAKDDPSEITFTEAFSDKIAELARADNKILAITAAMPDGTGLDKFQAAFPDRFFDVGIAEAHAVTFAGGLSRAGLKPVVAVYSTFLQRAFDQLIEDAALQQSRMVLAIDRAGIVGEDGATHQGVFDIAYLRGIPGFAVMAPKDADELKEMLGFAFGLGGPVAIRYPKGKARPCPSAKIPSPLKLGKAEVLKEGKAFVLIALGSMVGPALEAAGELEKENISGTVINARFAKPLDEELFKSLAARIKHIFTVEEGILCGGFGSAVQESLNKPVSRLGLPDEFIPHGKRELLLEKYGLSGRGIADKIRSEIKNG